jgi:hypothetical protein
MLQQVSHLTNQKYSLSLPTTHNICTASPSFASWIELFQTNTNMRWFDHIRTNGMPMQCLIPAVWDTR